MQAHMTVHAGGCMRRWFGPWPSMAHPSLSCGDHRESWRLEARIQHGANEGSVPIGLAYRGVPL